MPQKSEGLEVTGLNKTYPGGIRALEDVDLAAA